MDYLGLLRDAILALPVNKLRARRELYGRAKSGMEGLLRSAEPKFDEKEIVLELRVLELTIRCIERDIRAGIDIGAADYRPPEVDTYRDAVFRNHPSALRRRSAEAKTAGEADAPIPIEAAHPAVERLLASLRLIDAVSTPVDVYAGIGRRLSIVRALFERTIASVNASNPLGLVWMILEPAIFMSVIVIGYLLTGTRFVMNMEVVLFTVIGVLAWAQLRFTAVRIATGAINGGRDVLSAAAIRPFDVAVAETLFSTLVFSSAGILVVTAIVLMEMGPPPDSLLLIAQAWAGLVLLSFSVGLVLARLAARWRFALRVAPIVLRVYMLFSGIFYVTEQLPVDFLPYVLWSPTLHFTQAMRDGYFAEYESVDASLTYGFAIAGALLAAGLLCEASIRKRIAV